jgi:hypothetical protein
MFEDQEGEERRIRGHKENKMYRDEENEQN